MKSCRKKVVGRREVANLSKIVQLFELRCLTAYGYALIDPGRRGTDSPEPGLDIRWVKLFGILEGKAWTPGPWEGLVRC